MKDYHINIFYSEEDEGYIAMAKSAWLEAARAENKPIPLPRYKPVIYQAAS